MWRTHRRAAVLGGGQWLGHLRFHVNEDGGSLELSNTPTPPINRGIKSISPEPNMLKEIEEKEKTYAREMPSECTCILLLRLDLGDDIERNSRNKIFTSLKLYFFLS